MLLNWPAKRAVHSNLKARLAVYALCALLLLATGCLSGGGFFSGSGVDFSLSVSPGSQAVAAGNFAGYAINIGQKSGLGAIVQFSVTGLPPGSAASFRDQIASGPGSTSLGVLTAINTPPGTYQLTITGTDLTGPQTAQALLTVTPGPPPLDFVMDASPATQTTLGGGSVIYTASVSSSNAAPVSLSVSGLPSGAAGTFSPASITGTGTSTLTVVTQNPTAPGFYGLKITGSDSTGTQSVPVTLNIASVDFTLQQFVGPAVVNVGGDIIGTVTATPILGALGTVNLSVTGLTPGISANLNPLTLGGSVTGSTMTISTTSAVAPGIYQIAVLGSDTSGGQIAQIPFRVVPSNPTVGFFLAAVPDDRQVPPGGQANYAIVVTSPSGPVPSLTFSIAGLPFNASAQIVPAGINTFLLTITTDSLSDPSVSDISIVATGPNGSQQIDVSLEIGIN